MADNSVLYENNIGKIVSNLLNHLTLRNKIDQILHNSNSNVTVSTEETIAEMGSNLQVL